MMHRKRGLRMLILSMLSTSPKNGVEIMNDIEAATRGWWRPSPGSVYPLMDQLMTEGLVEKREDGRYELTEKASDQLEWSFSAPEKKPQTVDDMLNEMNSFVSYFEELNTSDQTKVTPHADRIKKLMERLSRLL